MVDKIICLLDNNDNALSVHDIYNALELETANDLKRLMKKLNELEDNHQICRTTKNDYFSAKNCKKEFKFINDENNKNNYNNKINSPFINNNNFDKRITNQKLDNMVGEYVIKDGKGYILLDNKNIDINIIISKKQSLGAIPGHKVLVKVSNRIKGNNFNGQIIKIIGHKNDPGIDMLSVIEEYGIKKEFPKKVIKEINNIKKCVTEDDINYILKKGGKDLRDEVIFTIDGDDTKDIDDAMSVKLLPNGNYEVGVHIANVSYYVKPGSSIFKEACKRGTSVYIPGSSIPMLPRELSNGICSLNPNVDRLALSFVMQMDKYGNIINFNIFESIINSNIQMTYKNVNKIIEDDITPEGYESYVDNLKILNLLAEKLKEKRIKDGCIDFDMKENKIILDEQGKAIDVVLKDRGKAEKLIEEFMVETGCLCSEFLDNYHKKDNGIHIYRNHGTPNLEKLDNLITYLYSLGYQKDLSEIKDESKNIQKLLEDIKNKEKFMMIPGELLKCMSKAKHGTNNIKHYALAKSSYCQTTSPIRRIGDLVNHTLIKENIYAGQTINLELSNIANNASYTERNADKCEREAVKIKSAEYMENHIGEEYEGIITDMESDGLCVVLPNLIEGFIPIESLTDDNYEFNRNNRTYVGKTSNHKYYLGDKILVKVKIASKEDRKVIFEVLNEQYNKVKKI